MKEWTLKWHKASEELPTESGNYLVCNEDNGELYGFQEVEYSKKYLAFNTYDDNKPEIAKKHAFAITNLYWSELPKTL